jgi:hypothetical protein
MFRSSSSQYYWDKNMRLSAVRLPFSLLGGALLIIASGCGGKTFEVEGTVEIDGKPVDSGSISFDPADGKGPSFGGVITDGKYKFVSPPRVEAGKRIVRITGMQKTGKQIPSGPPTAPGPMVDEIRPFPKRYNENSELSETIESGKANRFDFKLKSAP